jgi:chromosome partitioning protein
LPESLGERVALIDTDPQRSAADWWRARKLPRPAMAECAPEHLAKAIAGAGQRGITLCIVDTPPHAGQFAYLVAEAVDFNLIPCRPAPFDLRAIGKTVDIIAQLNPPAGIVINAAPPNRGDQEVLTTVEARKVLAR